MAELTREDLIEAARAAVASTSGPLSLKVFLHTAGITEDRFRRLFPAGGWRQLQELAGIERHPKDNESLSDEELLAEYHRVVCELGSIPTWYTFAATACISDDVVRKRFGGQKGTIARYRAWLETNHPDSPIFRELELKYRHERSVVPSPSEAPVKLPALVRMVSV